MQIPVDSLHPDTLNRVIEEYVSREGTDYGLHSSELVTKVEHIKQQLKSGVAVLCYDESSESCQILSREAYRAQERTEVQSKKISSEDPYLDFGAAGRG